MDDFIGGNNYEQTENQAKTKKIMILIGVIIALLLVVCISLVGLMYYIQSTELKISLDGQSNADLKNILIFEDGKIYIPIRDFSKFVNYESSNGGYKQYTEDATKCYVECANEVATFSLGSNKISKVVLEDNNTDTEYYEIDEPVKMINNKLCTTIDGAEMAFNIVMTYNTQTNSVVIYTLPYLVNYYTARFQNSAIADKDASFSNQKALLYNMIIIKNEDGHYGVNNVNGSEILGTKYSKIKFIESTQEFIVTTLENKMGIVSHDATTKISPNYDDIKQIDIDSDLYLVKNNNKYGVINSNESVIVYLEYDQIGINNSLYVTNNIENQYLLYNKCIPVKQNDKWGLFDKTGRKLTDVIYDDLGCSVGANVSKNQSANNILLVPKYEGIVVKKENLYGLIDSEGKELIQNVLTSFYSIISSGETTYYMTTETEQLNVIEYIEKYVKNNANTNETNNNQNEISNEETNQNQATNQANSNSEFVENNESSNTEQVNSSPTIDETNVQQ